ncbi:thioesterase II family protein [Roseofilum capinflatum]|uniref:Alpha/beta fold hydrolase n=1 Tax=Roseofilum capinflatum BLCC-M114 TaxID=3022440 RepID=A0ABT7B5P1_9CYAN|nr:alpha/beta fold hydrolase [Roseofilum capinflatum]MDJ1174142.1 alpha/beta fold hydrolase [Roseofilum capinflatum BLCC-M114]
MVASYPSTPWIIPPPQRFDAPLRLFCFPPAGAGALFFRPWLTYSSSDIELFVIQLPGREHRLKEPCFTDLEPLIKALTEAIIPSLEPGKFAFFGHSMGALIAFELTRELRRQGCSLPEYLFVCGRRAPQIPIDNPLYLQSDAILIEALRQYGGTPDAVLQNSDLMELFLPIFRADLKVNENYQYQSEPPLELPIAMFGAINDPVATAEQFEQWKQQTSARFDLQLFEGGHMFFKDDPELLLKPIFERL